MATYKKNKKGGFVDYYANASKLNENDYMLYNKDLATATATTQPEQVYYPPNSGSTSATTSSTIYATPNMSGGGKACDGLKDCDAFEFDNYDSFLYSFKGGCACNSSSFSGGNGMNVVKTKGGAFALTPYITAISLLAARLLTVKQLGFFPMKGGNKLKKTRRSRK